MNKRHEHTNKLVYCVISLLIKCILFIAFYVQMSMHSRSASIPVEPTVSKDYHHEASDEYPNGHMEYMRHTSKSISSLEARSTGWSMLVYGHHTYGSRKIYNKSCLGIYMCPECEYTERPRVPRTGKSKHALPRPAEKTCSKHKSMLTHVPCMVTMKVIQEGDMVHFIH